MIDWVMNTVSDPISVGVLLAIGALLFIGKGAPANELLSYVAGMFKRKKPEDETDDCYLALMRLADHANKLGQVELRDRVVSMVPEFLALHFQEK